MSLPEGPKCPKGAEVVGAEVVGAEVSINPSFWPSNLFSNRSKGEGIEALTYNTDKCPSE